MGTLNALLNLSESSLLANQTAINITANNVANQTTPGYTEEVANWQETDSVSLSGGRTFAEGATVSSASQRDRVLDQRVQQQTQTESATAAESGALTQLQSVFGLTSTSTNASATTIGTDISNFFNALSSLQASPADANIRQGVLSAAQSLAADLNGASNQISQQSSDISQQVGGIVGQVNTLSTSIAALNLQITSTSPTGDAGTLEDRRQQDITELSQLIGLNQTTTEKNGITLSTTDGAVLVGGGQAYPLSTADVGGNINVFSASPGSTDITANLQGGQLGGLLHARDADLPAASSALDQLAYGIATAINAQNEAGLDASGNPGSAIFSIPTSAAGTAGSIAVAISDPNALAAAAVGEGATGGTNAAALSGLQNANIVVALTPSAYFASFLTQLGTKVSGVSETNTVQQASLTQLTTQQTALSGVSLDQEASNLTEYQRSYEAAAKVFSIVDQLLTSALNLGEQTTVT
jgi:flagellar hook-associated protein 1